MLAVDAGVLVLATLGAFVLAGRTLKPIAEAMERQQRFAAAASHQLRTPLTVLQGTMEVALLRPRSPAEYEEALRTAVAEVERLSGLVANLLAVARSEQDREALHLATIDLRIVATEAVNELRSARGASRADAGTERHGPLCLEGDAVKLREAVSILLENAITYTPAHGAIRVVLRSERGRAVLEVRDTGPGIAAEHLPHLFEWFYRVNPAAETAQGHLGLGLAMAAWIARAHLGTLSVESAPGTGSVFVIALPLAGKRRLPAIRSGLVAARQQAVSANSPAFPRHSQSRDASTVAGCLPPRRRPGRSPRPPRKGHRPVRQSASPHQPPRMPMPTPKKVVQKLANKRRAGASVPASAPAVSPTVPQSITSPASTIVVRPSQGCDGDQR